MKEMLMTNFVDPHIRVSPRTGFLPEAPPLAILPKRFSSLEELTRALPELIAKRELRSTASSLPSLQVSSLNHGDELQRVATILGLVSHALVNLEGVTPKEIPKNVHDAWREVCALLGRHSTYLSYGDLIVHNWRPIDSKSPERTIDNLEVLVKVSGNLEERIFYMAHVEFLYHSQMLPAKCIEIGRAITRKDLAEVERKLGDLRKMVDKIRTIALSKIQLGSQSRLPFDPIIWARTVAPVAVPFFSSAPGVSGTANPFFHAMDAILGRSSYQTFLGKECLKIRESYPTQWRGFIHTLKRLGLKEFVESSRNSGLTSEFNLLSNSYSDLLESHRRKATAFLEIAFKVGRQITVGGFQGDFHDQEWLKIDGEFQKAMAERFRPTQLGACNAN